MPCWTEGDDGRELNDLCNAGYSSSFGQVEVEGSRVSVVEEMGDGRGCLFAVRLKWEMESHEEWNCNP
jgi:hypothetical protein